MHSPGPDRKPIVFAKLTPGQTGQAGPTDIDVILDIPMQLTVEIGRARMALRQLLELAQGSVIELECAAGSPADVLVNGRLISHGEVIVADDKFGVRLTDTDGAGTASGMR